MERSESSVARRRDRAQAWEWSEALGGRAMSVWQLERFKAVTAHAGEARFTALNERKARFSLVAWFRSLTAMVIAAGILIGYVLRHYAGAGQSRFPQRARRVAALHGEVSTRTRHVLQALGEADPSVDAILLLGRVSHRPEEISALWAGSMSPLGHDKPQIFLPLSPSATVAAFADMPRLIQQGLVVASNVNVKLGFREEVAMAFRVFLGAIAARWWVQCGTSCEVIFGITGTGDTTLLERAIHAGGGRTVHAVHGQANGPNFVGISDLALFRSSHDALAYAPLRCYGHCSVQESRKPEMRRASTGVLLLSNLAHPMNIGFQRFGLRDEKALLELVGAVAEQFGATARPLRWKPHPVISNLPTETRDELFNFATLHGFEVVAPTIPVESLAGSHRWVVISPSTVALDLLQAGCLSIVLDPQGSVLDESLSALPTSEMTTKSLAAVLRELDVDILCAKAWEKAFSGIGPARPFDLRGPLK